MTVRLLILAVCFFATAAYSARTLRPELALPREPLAVLPMALDGWVGRDDPPLSDDVATVLGADDYVSRTYTHGAQPFISLYVGYYRSQRHGDTIHSPLNCLPGAGWLPVTLDRTSVTATENDAAAEVNRVVIQKGMDRLLVLYWYQSHGRIVASEYWSKAYLVYDAIRTNRSDGALVRVITPIANVDGGEQAAERRAAGFVRVLLPRLDRHLPS